MAVTAAQVQYRQEFIATAERRESLLMQTVTREFVQKGNQATFLVAGSGNRSAVTRGTNGLIPASSGSQTQTTATLVEWHDKETRTDFDIFASQGNQREISMMNVSAVINRKCDDTIIDVLATTTTDTNTTAVTADIGLVMHAKTILHNNNFPDDGRVFAAVSPAFIAYLMQTKEFTSRDYVTDEKYMRGGQKMIDWLGVKWIMHTGLTGVGTSSESCFMWHETAVGLAVDTRGIDIAGGTNEEDKYDWFRASVYLGGAKLQNAGIVKMLHNGAGLASV